VDSLHSDLREQLREPEGRLGALLTILQQCMAGVDPSMFLRTILEDVLVPEGQVQVKRIAYKVIQASSPSDAEWEDIVKAISSDINNPENPHTCTMALDMLAYLPSKHLRDLLSESRVLLQNLVADRPEAPVRQAAVASLSGCLLRFDVLSYAVPYQSMLESVLKLWESLCDSLTDAANMVSYEAFGAVAAMITGFCRPDGATLAWLPNDVPNSQVDSKSVQSRIIHCVCRRIFQSRHAILNRVNSLPLAHRSVAVRTLTLSLRLLFNGTIEELHPLSGKDEPLGFGFPEVSSFLMAVNAIVIPYLSSPDPSLVFESAAWVLETAKLSDVHKSAAASAVTAVIGLLERNNFVVGRPVILACVARNLHLVDESEQMSIVRKLLLFSRVVRAAPERHTALILCSAAMLRLQILTTQRLSANAQQSEKPGHIFFQALEEKVVAEALSVQESNGPVPSFGEQLASAMLVVTLAVRPSPAAPVVSHRRWMSAAVGVLEFLKPCLKWHCEGRTFTLDTYLRLLSLLCSLEATIGSEMSNERLQSLLQACLVACDARGAATKILSRLVWAPLQYLKSWPTEEAKAERLLQIAKLALTRLLIDALVLEGRRKAAERQEKEGLLCRVLDLESAKASCISVEVAVLACERLGRQCGPSMHSAMIDILSDVLGSDGIDSIQKEQVGFCLQRMKRSQSEAERQNETSSLALSTNTEYPFGVVTASWDSLDSRQDRALAKSMNEILEKEELALTLEHVLPQDPEFVERNSHEILPNSGAWQDQGESVPRTLSGPSDACLVEGKHFCNSTNSIVTLHLTLHNMSEVQLTFPTVRLGLLGPLDFLHGQPQAQQRLTSLYAQDSVHLSFQAKVAEFGRCALCPFLIIGTAGDTRGYDDEGESGTADVDSAQLILRCAPYTVGISQFLLPVPCSESEFLRSWSALPATSQCWVEFASKEQKLSKGMLEYYDVEMGDNGESRPRLTTCWDTRFVSLVGSLEKSGIDETILCLNARTWQGAAVCFIIMASMGKGPFKCLIRSSEYPVIHVVVEEFDDCVMELSKGLLCSASGPSAAVNRGSPADRGSSAGSPEECADRLEEIAIRQWRALRTA